MRKILVTGGAGYIGSHTVAALIASGYDVCILDNLFNSDIGVLSRIEKISGKAPIFEKGDVRDRNLLEQLFAAYHFDAVIHFAGLKAVGESVLNPLDYYDVNVRGTLELLKVMRKAAVKTFVFSSSATVYGDPASVPIQENFPRHATNPYGNSKLIVEDILHDLCKAETGWNIARLRYFNPVGAHESGLIGEYPRGVPNNLMPYVAQVASGQRKKLSIFGNDYPTPDGTGVRDYLHVVDLADGHVSALDYLQQVGGLLTVNLGTGQGHSVLNLVTAFEAISGHAVPFEIVNRRPGDIAQCWADPSLAHHLINWKAKKNLTDMCADTWRWQQRNPKGYLTS
ncbi:MAG: UDP-glucose 4-epimerase GalE [Ottowia sp.]|nr:UDP-glucose 4-epimerase GalE [Ottowia sp.]